MKPTTFRVLIPVQDLDAALPAMELPQSLHAELALAFAKDTASAAADCTCVKEVVLVTRDPAVASAGRALGVQTLTAVDAPLLSTVIAAAHLETNQRSVLPTAVVMGDLPALVSEELEAALHRVSGLHPNVFAEDLTTGGTTFFAGRATSFWPSFGPNSAARNARAGSWRIGWELPGLRCDVDDLEGLSLASYLGVGQFTKEVLSAHPEIRPLRLAQ